MTYAVLAVASPGVTEAQIAHVLPRSGLWAGCGHLVVDQGALQTGLLLQLIPPHMGRDLVQCAPPREKALFGVIYDGKPTVALQLAADKHNLTPGILALWDGALGHVAQMVRQCIFLRVEVEVWLCEPDQDPRPLSLPNVRERLDERRASGGRIVLGAWPQGGAL